MIKIVNLKNTLNPISAAERVKINENWDELRRAFSQIQLQINFLSGGKEVNEIIERIENAIRMAETGSQQAIDRVNEALSDLNVVLNNLQTLTTETNTAKDNAISATNDARNAIQEISDFMNEFRSLGAWNNTTQYKRNNMASLNGNTYIALSDNVGVPTTNTNVWALFARRGFDGERGPQGEAGASLNVRGSLPNESALPSTGTPGDAYTINGDLYVWSLETSGWVNVGQIKGEKGDKGDAGESGFYQLANFQYVINATSNGQTTLQIPLESFDENNHSLLLFRNSTAQANDKYSVSGRTITLNEPVTNYTETSFYLFITQGVLIQPQETINASFIQNGTINVEKLSVNIQNNLNNFSDHLPKIASTSQLGHIKPDGITILVDSETGVARTSERAIPDATTSTKGITTLSNSITSNSEVLAATPRAVNLVNQRVNVTNESILPSQNQGSANRIYIDLVDSNEWKNTIISLLGTNMNASRLVATLTDNSKSIYGTQVLDIYINPLSLNTYEFIPVARAHRSSEPNVGWRPWYITYSQFTGSGSPEGTVYGIKGNTYIDSTNNRIYRKSVDSSVNGSNTGWVQIGV